MNRKKQYPTTRNRGREIRGYFSLTRGQSSQSRDTATFHEITERGFKQSAILL